jgi:hypothetical protein
LRSQRYAVAKDTKKQKSGSGTLRDLGVLCVLVVKNILVFFRVRRVLCGERFCFGDASTIHRMTK